MVKRRATMKGTAGRALAMPRPRRRTVGSMVGQMRNATGQALEPVDEGADSEMEANWEVTADPCHDSELQQIDYTGDELSETEKQLVNEGLYVFTLLSSPGTAGP